MEDRRKTDCMKQRKRLKYSNNIQVFTSFIATLLKAFFEQNSLPACRSPNQYFDIDQTTGVILNSYLQAMQVYQFIHLFAENDFGFPTHFLPLYYKLFKIEIKY